MAIQPTSQVKSSQYHFIANTNSVHKRQINKKVMGFVKGKPKGTNPAIMGNPINIYAVNGSKKQSVLLLKKPYLKHYVALLTATPSMRALIRLVNYNSMT